MPLLQRGPADQRGQDIRAYHPKTSTLRCGSSHVNQIGTPIVRIIGKTHSVSGDEVPPRQLSARAFSRESDSCDGSER